MAIHRDAAVADLSPWQCRRFGQTSSPRPGTCEALDVPPDPYVRVRLERLGRPLRSLPELAELMRNKRLLLLGDSVTGQIVDSMQCLSERGRTTSSSKLPPLAVRRFRKVASPTLERVCPPLLRRLFEPACNCTLAGMISKLDLRRDQGSLSCFAPQLNNGKRKLSAVLRTIHSGRAFALKELWFPAHNFSLLSDSAMPAYLRSCTACRCTTNDLDKSARQLHAMRHRGQPRSTEDLCDQDASMGEESLLPRVVQLVDQDDLADAIVLNLGLHWHSDSGAGVAAYACPLQPSLRLNAPPCMPNLLTTAPHSISPLADTGPICMLR